MVIVEYAKSFVGVPYKWAGESPMEGFDCSGFIQELLKSVGMDPMDDNSAQSYYHHFVFSGLKCQRTKGALVFYGKSVNEISHIALMINKEQIIEAGGGNHEVVDVTTAIRKRAFVRVRPYNYRKDVVTIILPRYPEWALGTSEEPK